MRQLGGAREEDVLHHERIEPLEQALGAVLVGFGLRGVLADRVDAVQLAVLHGVEHVRQVLAVPGLQGDAPGALELLPDFVVRGPVLETHEAVRDRAHVTATLHVVLPAERIHTRTVLPDVAGQEREIDQ